MDERPLYLKGGRGRGYRHNQQSQEFIGEISQRPSCANSNNSNTTSYASATGVHLPRSNKEKQNNAKFHDNNHENNDAASDYKSAQVTNHTNNCKPSKECERGHKSQVKTGEEIFKAAMAIHQEAAKRQLSAVDNNLFSDDDDEDEDEFDQKKNSVLTSFLQKLNGSMEDSLVGPSDLGRTASYIEETLKAKSNICLICIESVAQRDPVWNCSGCYTMFHIQCIQQWIRDGVQQKTTLSAELFPNKEKPWFCPKCRHEYEQRDFPKVYLCFCRKETNPSFDAWLVPHSCGQSCDRQLKPNCGHRCLLQCHPGPCPPCPKTVRSRCFCGKSSEQLRRCGASRWSCGSTCGRPLNCGLHLCPQPCHEGDCGECSETSVRFCTCGRKSKVVPCAKPHWTCNQVCDKELSCGHHRCQDVCHPGDCSSCSKDGKRKCPCGKTTFNLPCTEGAPTCLETCGKPLECGLHACTSRCHQGPCGVCREMIRKKCKCGRKEKELQCFKDFQCDVKCIILKDCGVHQCKRKCCDGNCPPCTAMCGKPLKCRQHKCANTCHSGPCYPCTALAVVKCNCGKTARTVPCGAEKKTKPPRCTKPCSNPPDCHHPVRVRHACHFGDCPRCVQTCDKRLQNCEHSCPASCHSAVKVEVKDVEPKVGPWQVSREAKKYRVVSRACPPCAVPLPVTCFGGHETFMAPCSQSKPTSCQTECGRLLPCLNHPCRLPCHVVVLGDGPGVNDDDNLKGVKKAGTNCQACEETCTKPRPPGCVHPCLLACHPGPCPPCSQMVKMRCHCQMVVKHVRCVEWCSAKGDVSQKEAIMSCQSPCPKVLPCSHRCKILCHPGDCPTSSDCSERVKVRCPCGRRKEERTCSDVQGGRGAVDCNKSCELESEKVRKVKEASERAAAEQEALRRKEELEEFERKSRGKRKRQRKQEIEQDSGQQTFLARNRNLLLFSLLTFILAAFVYRLVFHV